MDAYVKSEFHKGITSIEFFHPQSNSLPGKLLDELAKAIHAAGNDEETSVVLIRSFGDKAFCAGASFDELAAIRSKEEGLKFSGFAQVINAMRICPKLIIGRIHGKCVGGGVGLAAAVDYAIATEAAGETEANCRPLGLVLFVVGGNLPWKERSVTPPIPSWLLMPPAGVVPSGRRKEVCMPNSTIPWKIWMKRSAAWLIC